MLILDFRSIGVHRLLVERLAKVDPSAMTHEQKLAFWINLYNALLMHVSSSVHSFQVKNWALERFSFEFEANMALGYEFCSDINWLNFGRLFSPTESQEATSSSSH